MSRIAIPASIEAAPAHSRPLLTQVQGLLGVVPNMFRLIGTSPVALEGFLGLLSALGKGELPAQTRGRIALTVAQANGCDYCLAAHTYLGRNLKLDDAEMAANRAGTSADAKADAAVRFAVALVAQRGHVDEAAFNAVKNAGYSDAQIIEIVLHVALNTLTNYVNVALATDVDFPAVEALKAA
jgi:uncharacterized peroxidase-related enzyme